MRDKFDYFGQLYGYYLYLKFNIRSSRGILPQVVPFNSPNNPISKNILEEKICFIGDMERFLEMLKPHERKILEMRYQDTEATFEYIARWFRVHHKEHWPRRYFYRQNINECFHRVKHKAESYFIKKGYLCNQAPKQRHKESS